MASIPGAQHPLAGGPAARQRRHLLGRGELAGHDKNPALRRHAGPAGPDRAGGRLDRFAPARHPWRAPQHSRRAAGPGRHPARRPARVIRPNLPDWRRYLGIVRLVGGPAAAVGIGGGQPGRLAAVGAGDQRRPGPVAGRARLHLVADLRRPPGRQPDRGRLEPAVAAGLGTGGAPLARQHPDRTTGPGGAGGQPAGGGADVRRLHAARPGLRQQPGLDRRDAGPGFLLPARPP
ncbi:Uncharacterised protein [Achromobacter xylosoxidans]|nr:Uncharacterised protein [Achromobacter xylosoxidans]